MRFNFVLFALLAVSLGDECDPNLFKISKNSTDYVVVDSVNNVVNISSVAVNAITVAGTNVGSTLTLLSQQNSQLSSLVSQQNATITSLLSTISAMNASINSLVGLVNALNVSENKLQNTVNSLQGSFSAINSTSGGILFAVASGTVPITPSFYSGSGTPGVSADWSLNCASYASYLANIQVQVTMGVFVDYFRPVAGYKLCDLLNYNSAYYFVHSFTLGGEYTTLASGNPGGFILGSSEQDAILSFQGVANREFISAVGCATSSNPGGCCSSSPYGSNQWGQAFTIRIFPGE